MVNSSIRTLMLGLALLAVFGFAQGMSAQTTTEVLTTATETAGPASFGGSGYPFNRYYHDQRFQSVYLASEIVASGIPAGALISRVDLKISETPLDQVTAFRVRIQQASTTGFSSLLTTGWSTTSIHGPTNYPTTTLIPSTWVQMTFATPFLWNGTDNLLLEFTSDGTSYTDNGNVFLRTVTGTGRSFFGYADSGSAWPFDTGLFGNVAISQVPSLRLTYTALSAPSILNAPGALPNAAQGAPYTHTFNAAGGSAPYVWSVFSGTLPNGLTLNPTTGVLSGTPATATAIATPYSFSIRVTDSVSANDTEAFTLLIPPVTMTTSAGPLPAGFVGVAYSFTFAATGGTGGPYAWTVASGTLPAGLTLAPTTGVLSGTPTAATTSPVSLTILATDSVGAAQVQVTLSIGASLTTVEVLSTATETASNLSGYPFNRGWHDQRYQTLYLASELTAAGLSGGATIAKIRLKPSTTVSQDVPNMRIRTKFGTATGYTGWDNAGWTLQAGPTNFTIAQIIPSTWIEFSLAQPMVWNGTDCLMLEVTQDGTSYTGSGGIFTRATGANRSAYQYADSSWAAGPGGTTGAYPFDNAAAPLFAATAASLQIDFQASAVPVITTSSLPNAPEGVAYSASIAAAGGTGGPYVFAITGGALPSGLSLNPSSGVVSGTPAAATNSATPYSITVSATDTSGTGSKTITIVVPVLSVGVPSGALVNALGGFPYNQSVAAVGGGVTKVYTITLGALPVGLALNPTTGVISGTANPSQISAVPYAFTVQIADGTSTVSANYTILVTNPNVVIGSGTLASASSTPLYRSSAGSGFDVSIQKTLYLQSQLSAIPSGSQITGIAFYKNDTQSSTTGSSSILRVWLKNSTLTALPASEPYTGWDTGATLVYDSTTHNIPGVQGWINFGPFNQPTPFIYNGGALEVLVFWDCLAIVGNPTTGSFSWQYSTPPNANTGLGYSSSVLPTATTSLASGTNGGSVRQPNIRIEMNPPVATDLDITNVTFNAANNTGPNVGAASPNIVNVTIKTFGSAAFNGNIPLSYSTDGGINWTSPQNVTASGLNQLGDTQIVSLTTPWIIPSLAAQSFAVRIFPVVTGDPDATDVLTRTFSVDADVTAVRAQTGPFVGNNNIIVTVKNSGALSLNGQPITMDYSVDGGTTFGTPQVFTPTTLGGLDTTEEFTFTAPWNLITVGNYTVVARINPPLPGDPDTVDSASRLYQDAGGAFEVLSAAPEASSGGGTTAGFPFNTYWHDMRMEAIYLASELTQTGLYPSAAISAIQLKVSQLPGQDLNSFRIRMQHTSASVHSGLFATSGYTDVFGPSLLSITAVPPVMVVDQWVTFTFAAPFYWNGTDNLLVDISHDNTAYITGGGCYMRTPPGTTARHLKGYSDSGYTWPFDGMTNGGTGTTVPSMRVMFPPPSNPGVAVSRGAVNINDASTDNLGNAIYATLSQTRTWSILNYGASINLNVSAVNITNQSNVLATVTTSPVGTPILPLGTGTLTLTVAPQAGPYSFDVELVTNSATASQQSFTWTVTGVGFVNSIPQIQVIGNSDIQVSGVHPNYLVEMVSQTNMNFEIRAVDPDTAQTVNLTVATATGGTLTAAQAGFTTTFPVSATAGVSPRVITMAGIAGSPGTTNLVANSSDDGTIAANDMINIQVKIGARLDIMTTTVASQFVRVNGRKDFYRGQTAQPVSLTVTNANPFAIQLNAVTFKTVTTGNVAITGFNFTIQNGPVTIPANTTAMPVSVLMDIAANASGINGAPITFNSASGVAVDPVTATNIVIVKVLSADSEFDLYDGPVPMPFQITSTTLGPAVQTVPYLQNLNATGGTGSYTWSIAASSQFGLPSGLTLNPQGSAFLPASISGQPTTTATPGTYAITFECTDGAYVDTEVLSITVSILTPLTFPPVSLANGQEFVAYSMTAPFAATGGSLIYTFSVSSSSNDQLPTGLSLNSVTGVISGTPASGTQGSYNITFEVSDGVSSLTQVAQLTIVQLPLQWRGTTVPTAVQTVSYSEALDAIGGTGPRIYSIVSGTLPNGLSLSAATGVISGIPSLTPNSIGTYNMVFKVTDGLNASVNQAITITVVAAPPLAVTTSVLDYGMVGMTYAASIGVTGGSQNYVISVASSSAAQVPAGLALAPNGDITGTPAIGSDGRYALELSVNDGFQTITRTVILPVLAGGARGMAITEVDAATGYVELTNSEDALVDVSGWSITVWVDSNTPVSLPFDSIPGASLALPAEVVTITLGGTAGGFWPTYATGGTWTGTSTSNISVLLSDIHGNTIDFVSFGSGNRASLVDAANAAIDLPTPLNTMANANNGAANYSYNGMAWVGSTTGTPGIYNAGLASFPLAIIKDNVRTANSGQAFSDFTFAIGGRAPYTFTLTAPAATWLSLSTGGVFSGTAPTVTTDTTVSVDVTVTDALSVAVTETFEIRIAPASTTPSATFTVGNAEGQSFEGTVIDVPVTMTRANGVTDVMGFGFVIELAASTALELDVVRVLPGPATIAAGSTLVARDLGNNRIFVGDYSSPTAAPSNFADGVVAIVRFMVPADNNVMAPEATYAVNIADVEIGRTATGVHTAAGVNGSMILSNYKPQDVNRDNAIDVVDVQQTVNIILSLFTPTYAGQGDANSDNAVDVVDVQTIVNCILLGGC